MARGDRASPHKHIRAQMEPPRAHHRPPYSPVQQKMSPQPYVFPASLSPQVKAVQGYLKYISEFDIDSMRGLLTDAFTLSVSPASLGVPDKTRAEEFAFIKEMQAKLDGKPLVVSRVQTWRGHPFGTVLIANFFSTDHSVRSQQWTAEDLGPCIASYKMHRLDTDSISQLGGDRNHKPRNCLLLPVW